MNAIAGISGGRTSGMMAYMLDPSVVLSFQNTGDEDPRTYDFIDRLEQDLARPIVRLEFRAPARGDAPRFATFEIVEHRHLNQTGGPFDDMLECLRTFRAKHNAANPVDGCKCNNCKRGAATPIAPWARQRVCTAYCKVRTQRKYCASLGWSEGRGLVPARHLEYTEYVGLRADEPDRVARMKERNDRLDTDERAILAERGLVKVDVLRFWAGKPFDLEAPEHLGNCTKCFMKDERDIATAMIEHPIDNARWVMRERVYGPMRRGGRPSYAQVLAEAPERMRLRAELDAGRDPLVIETSLPRKRVRLIVAQERAPRQAWSCECDAAKADDFDEMIEAA